MWHLLQGMWCCTLDVAGPFPGCCVPGDSPGQWVVSYYLLVLTATHLMTVRECSIALWMLSKLCLDVGCHLLPYFFLISCCFLDVGCHLLPFILILSPSPALSFMCVHCLHIHGMCMRVRTCVFVCLCVCVCVLICVCSITCVSGPCSCGPPHVEFGLCTPTSSF